MNNRLGPLPLSEKVSGGFDTRSNDLVYANVIVRSYKLHLLLLTVRGVPSYLESKINRFPKTSNKLQASQAA